MSQPQPFTSPASPSQWPSPLELGGPFAHVPSLEELEDLTDIADRRVVFRGVDWSFYDRLVDSIPEWRKIHVDYDGKDLEIVRYGILHHRARRLLDMIATTTAEVSNTPFAGIGGTTWNRPETRCGLEACHSYYFDAEKRAVSHAAHKRHSNNIADYPNPDLAIEVDMTPPQVDRAGIYAALRVAEVWRFDGNRVVIDRLRPDGKYVVVSASGFLPIRADEIEHWVVNEDIDDDRLFYQRFRAYLETRTQTTAGLQPGRPPGPLPTERET
jgi:Uma2 family endonuclease